MVNEQLSKKLKISIGGIGISVTANNRLKIDKNFCRFLSQGHPEVILRAHYGYIPQIELEEKIFDGTVWKLYRGSKKFVLRILQPPRLHPSSILKLGVFKSDFTSGEIYMGMKNSQNDFPLRYPLDQILMISLLSQGKGLLIHSCGIDSDGEGMLFAGSSGAGKSTIASLGINKKGIKVLSDDRIIIRKFNGRFWIYGTPWHGDTKVCSPAKVSLEKIFFLKHAKKNSIKKITPVEAISRLIICSFPTFWDKKGMEFTLKFCTEIAQKIPCYELRFVPDKGVLDFVRG